jgi:hypothetical protein
MAILQISKIQQRSGNLVDLPQLDDAEFGWATDAKRLFIGKSTPNENIEVLTSYSQINFSQINGSVGNLNISNVTLVDGQVLAYDGSEWVNKGGDAGGLITLGDVSNVKIDGGAIGYVLETDGVGNLSWTPKSSITSFFENVTKADPAVVTTTQDNFFTQGASITVTNVTGMTQLNGNVYYVDVLTSNTFALYHDSGLANTVDSTGYGTFPYATVSATDTLTDQITVSDATPFTVNDPVVFTGELGNSTIVVGQTYYVKTKDTSAPNTWITISTIAGGNTFDPGTEASPTGAAVYVPGGRAVSLVSGGTSSLAAAGTPTQIQYNDTNLLQGNADFTYNNSTKLLTLNGNANVGNLNATGVSTATRFISNIANGTPPLQVTSVTRVANLSVAYSNVSDFGVVTTQTTGTFYPVMVSANTSANYALASNANISFNAATGNLSVTLLNASSNANVGNLGTAGLIVATGNVTGGNLVTGGALSVTGNANVGNLGTARVIATGNISGTQLISNIATGTAPLVVTSTTTVANLAAATATTAGTVTTAAQPNITSVGTLTSLAVTGNISAGNVSATTFTGALSGAATSATTAGTVTTAAQPNITSVGTLTGLTISTATGRLGFGTDSGGALSMGLVDGNSSSPYIDFNTSNTAVDFNVRLAATGPSAGVGAGNLYANAAIVAIGNALTVGTTANITGNVTAGNVSATTFTGALTGAASTAGTVTTAAQPNITSTGTLTSLAVTGNISAGNVSATTFTGALTGAATTAGTVTTAAQPNITSVGTLTSLGVSGALTTTQITAGANTTAGNITGNWTLTTGSSLTATYADLAEYYEADVKYLPGTVLMFGGEKEVTLADDGTNKVAGVVSTNPAYVMNSTCPGLLTAVALQGRVPCKVRGKISKGDMLISGGNGFARPNQFPSMGTVIGKALQDFDGYEGVIEVAVGRL